MGQWTIAGGRELSPQELNLLNWLIQHGTPEAAEFTQQVRELKVISGCECGCPSIDFSVGGREKPKGGMQILSDHLGETDEGVEVGVFLFAIQGLLAGIEVYDLKGQAERFSLPRLESLRPI